MKSVKAGKTEKAEIYIQPDARGRIQLPKSLRHFPLFKLEEKGSRFELIPLRVVEEPKAQSPEIWLRLEVESFLEEKLFPQLKTFLKKEKIPEILSVFLYGSRARGDALSHSDFDFGILCENIPSLRKRNEICDQLLFHLSDQFEVLKAHGAAGEPSFHFFSINVKEDETPPIHFSIESDGKLIWDRGHFWEDFLRSVLDLKKKWKVKSEGSGRARKWTWKKPD